MRKRKVQTASKYSHLRPGDSARAQSSGVGRVARLKRGRVRLDLGLVTALDASTGKPVTAMRHVWCHRRHVARVHTPEIIKP